ncbi:MAG: CARDB domain-containing protein [Candidatus Binatia bacterium]
MKTRTRKLRTVPLFPIALCGFALGACAPDLTIDQDVPEPYTVDWSVKEAIANVANKGNATAGEFLVYLEISREASPETARPESQGTKTVASLPAGESTEIRIPFTDFGIRSIDLMNATAGLLEVRIDAKNTVKESDEENNYFSAVF